ncbi:MAG: NUDIX hydrolase [Candidatus Zixiibacteriota bacterium]
METRYGVPAGRRFDIPCTQQELDRIRSSQRGQRDHDVTLYIRKGTKWVVIAKHAYPPGLYRSPSGGLHPGEDFETGIAREVSEETGCEVSIDRFLLKTSVRFFVGDSSVTSSEVRWRSFVFLTTYLRGDFNYTDHREIREVRLVDWSEFASFGKVMRTMGMGGLWYRAELHEAVAELLEAESAT